MYVYSGLLRALHVNRDTHTRLTAAAQRSDTHTKRVGERYKSNDWFVILVDLLPPQLFAAVCVQRSLARRLLLLLLHIYIPKMRHHLIDFSFANNKLSPPFLPERYGRNINKEDYWSATCESTYFRSLSLFLDFSSVHLVLIGSALSPRRIV